MSDLQPGFNEYMDDVKYHGDTEYVSSSGLKLVLRDIRKYYKQYIEGVRDPEDQNKPQFAEGKYIHALFLEPHLVDEHFAFYDGVKRGKEWEKFKEDNKDKQIVGNILKSKGAHYLNSLAKNEAAQNFLKDGEPEKTACAIIDGVKVKVRTDYLQKDAIVDVKTTSGSLELHTVAKSCAKYDYDLSAALYVDVIAKITGKELPFIFLFANKDTYDIAVFKASQQMIENGRRKYKAAIKKLKECRESGEWVDNELKEIFLPDYAIFEG